MRLIVSLALLVPLALAACKAEVPPPADGAPPAEAGQETGQETGAPVGNGVETADGTVYGEAIGEAPAVELTALVADPDTWSGQRVRVSGLVTGVCAKRGCWINIGAEEGPEQVTFKVTDGVIVFPMSAQGKWVEAEGTVQKIELNLERSREYLAGKAVESGEEFDPASVTEPLTLVRLGGLGAVVTDARPGSAGE